MKTTQGILEFVQVVEEGGFSAAARRLGTSKAYISQKISQLEGRLGVRLLQRTTRKLSLTEAGQIYHRYAKEIARQLNEAEERVRDFHQSPKGRIRVSMVDGGYGVSGHGHSRITKHTALLVLSDKNTGSDNPVTMLLHSGLLCDRRNHIWYKDIVCQAITNNSGVKNEMGMSSDSRLRRSIFRDATAG